MAKSILLARPHPFIVSEMRPFLEENGYIPKKLSAVAEIPAAVAGSSGAIISLAVVSSIAESAETVYSEVRRSASRLPVLFAAMMDFSTARGALERLAKASGTPVTILDIGPANENHPALGKPGTYLYLSKDDLASQDSRKLAASIIRRHFR